ncbi:MAG: response regulator transcription factor [Selenomonadaceae bacterium]
MELEHEGFLTGIEANGRIALDRIIQEDFDLILLDLMLPELDGIEICRRVRAISDVPILMLTAKDDIADKVTGLNIGADDYITKPFAIQELIARIGAALRKSRGNCNFSGTPLCSQDLRLYPERYEAFVGEQKLVLTKKEYDLLEFLLRNQGIVLSRERILQDVWGYDFMGDTKIVDVYIRYLRSKLDEYYRKKYIYTVRGVGYVVKN